MDDTIQRLIDLDKRTATDLAILQTRLDCKEEARALQAKEYERRLEELNHAHQQQMDRNAQYVSRETWELQNSKMEDWRRSIDRMIYIAIGAGIAGGGIAGVVARMLG